MIRREFVESGFETNFDIVKGQEELVGEVFFTHLVPNMLHRIAFGGIRRKELQPHAIGDFQALRLVPPGPVQKHDDAPVRNRLRDETQERVESVRVALGREHRDHAPLGRRHRSVGVCRFAHDLSGHERPHFSRSPTGAHIADAPETPLALEKHREVAAARRLLGQDLRELFLNADSDSGFFFGCDGRGTVLRQPSAASSR